jgi:hypothetical protein
VRDHPGPSRLRQDPPHRLHRGGDRDANRALQLAVVVDFPPRAGHRGYAARVDGSGRP